MKPFRTLLILLLVAAVGILAAQWLAHQQQYDLGQVVVQAGGNDYIATLPQAVLALVIFLVVLWLLWTLLLSPLRAWNRYRRKQDRTRLLEGLQALDRGHWQRAERLLLAAAKHPETASTATIAAVSAAEARGDQAAASQHLLQLASIDATDHALLSAERWLAQQRPLDAINALDVAAAQPLPPRGVLLRTEALAQAGRAAEAYGQLGALRQQQVLPADALAALEVRLAAQALDEAADVNALATQWEATPKALRLNPVVVSAYARRAAELGWEEPAMRSLETALDTRWDESLVRVYGSLPGQRWDARSATAGHWLQAQPSSISLLLTLARLEQQQGNWAQAETYLHRAAAQGAGAPAWEALGEGYAARGEDTLARQCLLNALRERRGEPPLVLTEHALHRQVPEQRDEHGLPRLHD